MGHPYLVSEILPQLYVSLLFLGGPLLWVAPSVIDRNAEQLMIFLFVIASKFYHISHSLFRRWI